MVLVVVFLFRGFNKGTRTSSIVVVVVEGSVVIAWRGGEGMEGW